MALDYQQIMEKIGAPKAECAALIEKLRGLSIPADAPLAEFFTHYREIALRSWDYVCLLQQDPLLKKTSLKELEALYEDVYSTFTPGINYDNSIQNPDYTHKLYGAEIGPFLSAICSNAGAIRHSGIDGNYVSVRYSLDLFFALWNSPAKSDYNALLNIYKQEHLKIHELLVQASYIRRFSPQNDYFYKIVHDADLDDIRYMYRYCAYLSKYDMEMAEFIAAYPPQELAAIARFVVKSWVDGFVRAKKDYKKKKYANLIIPIGMEALGRLIIDELEAIGITALVPQLQGSGFNRQYPYDHRYDSALMLDRDFVDKSLQIGKNTLEEIKDIVAQQAGPIYVELFGETPFSPINKSTTLKLSEEQQQLMREYQARSGQLYYSYYKREEASFTIIAFPSTEIGDKFPEIFADTLRINLLDSKRYATIQQKIIDVLDTAEYVHVKGKGTNETDIKVQMHHLKDPTRETLFENCVADVNIPVGEVFTSPVLKGTTGILHVEDIYLGSLRYFNLKIEFEDGWVKNYSCTNYDNPEESRQYVFENLLFPHKSLPIGEFAIGTNTSAYQMAKKYDIMSLLPILIIEKMGPHFAIGDTCFSHEEDSEHPSFVNGKEMIAVDNEQSAKRKDDPVNAYLMHHTDITLPYEMLEFICAVSHDGKHSDIIRNGRFVIPGTEELNIPLIEMEETK
ncbi:MAG: aminopeptidase [Candidatus Cloacimonetes bacterium]|jgi:leucyl aminopeptidase (aminopeptidase T)|nr:aminopeptidase [Candidatus Cloacimonadota bacterium]MDD3283279.1 aminopeptidase [Candidatus Cloacimonadota bacterium]MDD4232478.1 aminopeptidase [Candidatus Cloacimonadota bacterium]MDY0299575.1 aminopeptidase [Candidatus Cloacimonadaceae bacterium]